MIANKGWHYFDMPTCVAPGDYLLRVELIALHGAQTQGPSPISFLIAHKSLASLILSPNQHIFSRARDVRLTLLQVAHSSIWNVPIFASSALAPIPARTSCLSQAPFKQTTRVCRSVSMIMLGNHTWVGRSIASQARRRLLVLLGRRESGSTPAESAESAALHTQCGGATWTGPTVCAFHR
jgi:hypothetical protein